MSHIQNELQEYIRNYFSQHPKIGQEIKFKDTIYVVYNYCRGCRIVWLKEGENKIKLSYKL